MAFGDPVELCGETEVVDPTAVGTSGLKLMKLSAVLLTVISEVEVVMRAGSVELAPLVPLVSLLLCFELALAWTLDFLAGGC